MQTHCYAPMDELLKRKKIIQQKLADKHLQKDKPETIILYDITALTHGNMKELLENKTIQLDLFDEKNIVEVNDLEAPEIRYCLCKNPHSARKETTTRKRLLELSESALQEIASYQRKCTVEMLGARVGRVLQKYKMGKFINWHVDASADGESKSSGHKLIVTFRNLIEDLKSIRSNTMRAHKVEYEIPTQPSEKQQTIITRLEQIS